ncbi:hypothetical protein KAR91_49415 [Candidatus Pacearchaeota archaeon]|nr:hypothetical protein [Candidatus Pacearchaeota archaeon]
MKTDCIFYNGCYLPKDSCNDNCWRYDKEGKHPFEDDEDRGCEEYHMRKDMGEI